MDSYRDVIERTMAEGMAPGVVVLVGRGGRTVLHEAFGRARTNPDVPMRPDAVFDMASVTKAAATAAACTVCVDDGRLALDAPLGRYLPGLGLESRDILVRDVASHVSGFDNAKHYYPEILAGRDPVAAIQRERPVRKPGAQYEYSCVNFMLLGFVVEAVSGLRLDAFCEQRIFGPLGMRDTRFGPIDGHDERVVRMSNVEPGIIADEPARAAARPLGNAGLFSTAADLGRFAAALLGGSARDGVRILSPAAAALFARRLNQPPHRPRSFGWDLDPELRPANLSDRTYYHTGWTGQSLYVDPGSGAYAIVLTNRTGDHDRARFQRQAIAEAAVAEA